MSNWGLHKRQPVAFVITMSKNPLFWGLVTFVLAVLALLPDKKPVAYWLLSGGFITGIFFILSLNPTSHKKLWIPIICFIIGWTAFAFYSIKKIDNQENLIREKSEPENKSALMLLLGALGLDNNTSSLTLAVTNMSPSEDYKDSNIHLGLIPFIANTPDEKNIGWIKSNDDFDIKPSQTQFYNFKINSKNQIDLTIQQCTFVLVFIKIKGKYISGIWGFTANKGGVWWRWGPGGGGVDPEQLRQSTKILNEMEKKISNSSNYDACFVPDIGVKK